MAFTRGQIELRSNGRVTSTGRTSSGTTRTRTPRARRRPVTSPRPRPDRLNALGLGDNPDLELVESRVERVPPGVRITHVFEDRDKGARFETEPFTGYE